MSEFVLGSSLRRSLSTLFHTLSHISSAFKLIPSLITPRNDYYSNLQIRIRIIFVNNEDGFEIIGKRTGGNN